MRCDTAPFDNLKVRRALNMAVDKQAILNALGGGMGEMVSFPFAANWPETYYTPWDELPESVKEIYTYNPEKARELLTEAGYPDGFKAEMVIRNLPAETDVGSMLVSFWADVNVDVEMLTMEYAALSGVRLEMSHTHMFFQSKGNAMPESVLRAPYLTGQYWNIAAFNDPYFEEEFMEIRHNPNLTDTERLAKLKAINVYLMEQTPYLSLASGYYYRYAWPWVMNYYGEHNVSY